ncbi:MAG: accessory Sec system translocase SecA2 [Acidobacteriota bacterium]
MSFKAGFRRLLRRLAGEPVERSAADDFGDTARDIEAKAASLRTRSDGQLRERAETLREQAQHQGRVDVVDGLSLVREAGERVLGLRLHDAQVLAAVALHHGRVVELATGEGKTLAAVGPAWLGALAGRGSHVLTFNDYLARRDAEWMGPVYQLLGASLGCVQEGDSPEQRREAWASDVTYATAKQSGFDYLRDSRVLALEDRVHRPFHQAIVDEADSLMVDEARVPLVLAGGEDEPPVDRAKLAELAAKLEDQHFEVEDNARHVALTPSGIRMVEASLDLRNLHEDFNREVHAGLNLALHARTLLHRDVDYVVADERVQVIDEFTGRVVPDRRWPDGLHPALEAKEELPHRKEGRVLASIPLQHFFPLYPRLAGMTGTAVAAADELDAFYGLEVAVVPSHRACVREDRPDRVFSDREAKLTAVIEEIRSEHELGRPILVGTANIIESEALAARLRDAGVECRVLNAKNDEEEAVIVADAGRKGAVTISTNLAGRGTDIRLGGHEGVGHDEVAAVGGLHVIGTNKHESSRVDDQLRGRAGRQGDPGSSRFFVSLEDDLVERYGLAEMIDELSSEGGDGGSWESRAAAEIDRAQRIVEGQNFDIRKTLWKYSRMVRQQRERIDSWRARALDAHAELGFFEEGSAERRAELLGRLGEEEVSAIEHRLVLIEVDEAWCRHLVRIADVREGIHLQQMGNQDWFGGLWSMRKGPFDVFHEMAIEAFEETWKELEETLRVRYQTLEVGSVAELTRPGLTGPESTWTYLVTDTPFETTIIRLYRGVRKKMEE